MCEHRCPIFGELRMPYHTSFHFSFTSFINWCLISTSIFTIQSKIIFQSIATSTFNPQAVLSVTYCKAQSDWLMTVPFRLFVNTNASTNFRIFWYFSYMFFFLFSDEESLFDIIIWQRRLRLFTRHSHVMDYEEYLEWNEWIYQLIVAVVSIVFHLVFFVYIRTDIIFNGFLNLTR